MLCISTHCTVQVQNCRGRVIELADTSSKNMFND